jgi:hypothetical protein
MQHLVQVFVDEIMCYNNVQGRASLEGHLGTLAEGKYKVYM